MIRTFAEQKGTTMSDLQNLDMTNADEIDRMAHELAERATKMRADKRRAEMQAAQAERKAEAEAHYALMFAEIGQPLAGLNEAQHDIVYAEAYEQGHSYGLGEVETSYGQLAEMARKLIDAN